MKVRSHPERDFCAKIGKLTIFDVAGGGTGNYQGTWGWDINPARTVAGDYIDSNNVYHGFVRASDGTITTFDAQGAGTGYHQGTFPASCTGLTPKGEIAGTYIDSNGAYHGYVRDPSGTITTFDVSGAGTGSGQGTIKRPRNAALGILLNARSEAFPLP